MDNKQHLYQITCWQAASGNWYCNDVKNLGGKSAKWYAAMRMLGLTIEEFIELLMTYGAINISYYEPTDYLSFSFEEEKDAKAFCSYVNKQAKTKNFYCLQ